MPHRTLLVISMLFVLAPDLRTQDSSAHGLVNVLGVDSTIRLDIRYATAQNFTHTVLYPAPIAKLRRAAAESLSAVQRELRTQGLCLKIYDAYRPLSIQKKLWAIMPNEDFVANPKTGSRHNRGAAVDLTIIDSLGVELEMPTEYDSFSERAGQDFMDLPPAQLHNRELLKAVMMHHGFLPLRTEWWHFDFKSAERFDVLDEPLE